MAFAWCLRRPVIITGAACFGPSFCATEPSSAATSMKQKWQWEENKAGNKPPSGSWPPVQPDEDEIPSLRQTLLAESCCVMSREKEKKTVGFYNYGSERCREVGFALAIALLDAKEGQGESVRLLEELAEAGSRDAATGLGLCLAEGRGGAKVDSTRALHYYKKAADAGCAEAMHAVGVMYFLGSDDGVGEDEQAAVAWFQKAASENHAGSMYMLGDCLLDGIGVAQDRDAALKWLIRAGELGHRGARSRVLAILLPPPEEDSLHEADESAAFFTDSSRQTLVSEAERAQARAKLKRRKTRIASDIN